MPKLTAQAAETKQISSRRGKGNARLQRIERGKRNQRRAGSVTVLSITTQFALQLPRRGCISKPRVAKRTLGSRHPRLRYPEGVSSPGKHAVDETLSG